MTANGGSGIEEVQLRPVGVDGCSETELESITSRLTGWLNSEYPEESLREPHDIVSAKATSHYAALRREGMDDLAAILLALGGRLEEDMPLFRELFVGPWEVANKLSDLVIAGAFGIARPPSGIDDDIGRYSFIQRLLDLSVPTEEVNGAVAITAGWIANPWGWDGTQVTMPFFRGDSPPDVLGELYSNDWTEELKHLESDLGIGADVDPAGKQAEALNTFIDALHGFEMSRIQRDDPSAVAWRKLEVVAKWLHLRGDF